MIYVDETEISLRHGKGYVWVLTNSEEVVYLFRPNREAGFLKDLLKGFQGVVVRIFYSGYDGLRLPSAEMPHPSHSGHEYRPTIKPLR